MKARPILFQGAMVRALLDGSKTQTRRIVKSQPPEDESIMTGPYHPTRTDRHGEEYPGDEVFGAFTLDGGWALPCPYGQPSDHLWVRESYADVGCRLTYRADLDDGAHCKVGKWTPSIHMFREDSRILLEIVSVRVERLNDISETDARAEGIIPVPKVRVDDPYEHQFWRDYCLSGDGTFCVRDPSDSYRSLWESINGAGSWAANPFVWCVEFRRVQP